MTTLKENKAYLNYHSEDMCFTENDEHINYNINEWFNINDFKEFIRLIMLDIPSLKQEEQIKEIINKNYGEQIC